MKKAVCLLLILAALLSGYFLGKRHVILGADMFVVELPERNESGGFTEDEITVYLEIDNQVHEYGCWIG